MLYADSNYNLGEYNFFYDQFVCEEKNITSEVLITPPCTENPPGPPSPPAPPSPPVGPCPSTGSFRIFTTLPQESSCPVTASDILTPGTCGIASPTLKTGYIPFMLVNNSGQTDANVYISVYIPANSTTSNKDAYLQFDGLGVGSIANYTHSTYLSNYLCPGGVQYSYPLNFFPTGSVANSRLIYIPNSGGLSGQQILQSSRIFISLGSSLNYFIDYTGALQVTSPTTIDDNYFVLYDKVEFDLGSNSLNRLNLNLTGVDFFGLPLLVKATYSFLGGTTYCPACATTGWPQSIAFSQVFNLYQNYLTTLPDPFKGYWSSLLTTYINPDNSVSNLRIFSPATAMGSTQSQQNPTKVSFPTNYFLSDIISNSACTWFNAVWQGGTVANPVSYYMQKPSPYLILDATTSDFGVAQAKGNLNTNGSFIFSITGGSIAPGSTITIPKPTSSKAFFTGAVSDYTPAITGSGSGTNTDLQSQVFKVFATSIIAGLFPINSLNPSVGLIDQTYVVNNSASYFQNNSTLEGYLQYCSCNQNIPWYDFYSRSMLSIGQNNRFYTSAYSDFLQLDGTIVITDLQGNNANAFVTVYVNDCTATLPDPYGDTTNYSVTVSIPNSTTVPATPLLTVSYGTASTGPWTPITNGQTVNLAGDGMFFQVQYLTGNYTGIDFVTQIVPIQEIFHPVLPEGGSIILEGTNVTISFGAAP